MTCRDSIHAFLPEDGSPGYWTPSHRRRRRRRRRQNSIVFLRFKDG